MGTYFAVSSCSVQDPGRRARLHWVPHSQDAEGPGGRPQAVVPGVSCDAGDDIDWSVVDCF